MLQSTTLRLQPKQETLRLNLEFDLTSGLPLLEEQDNILQLILTYLALPYSVAEYGCGRKTSIILKKLFDLGIPYYALRRGMIMESDMSGKALQQEDYRKRQGALVLDNPLYNRADLKDPVLLKMLEASSVYVHIEKSHIYADDHVLSHEPQVQFVQARSHIFALITFWDNSLKQPVERILDPTISPDHLLEMAEMRRALHAQEALVFTSHTLANFRLEEDFLSSAQQKKVKKLYEGDIQDLTGGEHRQLILKLNGAQKGSIGDPAEWTYANNIIHERPVAFDQKHNTGRGDIIRRSFEKLLETRQKNSNEVLHHREFLESLGEELAIKKVLKEDADLSENELLSLADVANTVSCYLSLKKVGTWLKSKEDLFQILNNPDSIEAFHGFGVRLRKRIEDLASVSEDDFEKIDARVFSQPYNEAAIATIKQMNEAGLAVCIDRVGNIHGLLVRKEVREKIRQGQVDIKDIAANAICHCSHIDTVKDAGKYDGRLGVLSGVEIAHTLFDLQNYFDIKTIYPDLPQVVMVSAFTGEEMTYTGEGIAMPGSAAVTGLAAPEDIYQMENTKGEKYGDKLLSFFERLQREQAEGFIELVNDFSGKKQGDLPDACFEPTDFFTSRSYERHVEQGPVLDRNDVPMVLVDTIMGIHQEDFYIRGKLAETAALELNRLLRHRSLMKEYSDIRVTCGILDHFESNGQAMETGFAQRWTLIGEKNHAGATLLEDRRDPGVALARLTRYYLNLIERLNEQRHDFFIPIIGEVSLDPGTNRNVIPEKASITFGIRNGLVPEEQKHLINYSLQHFVVSVLSPAVKDGGEGVNICQVQLTDFLNSYSNARLSIDLRGPSREKMKRFRDEVDEVLGEIKRRFDVTIESQLEQQVPPYPLRKSGQVLQIERSFGGSHNPNEAELAEDLVRGSLLQFAATLGYAGQEKPSDIKLFDFVDSHIPLQWKKKLPAFVSGALHDTCNIASVALNGKKQ